MKRECVEIEVQLNGKLVTRDKAVPIQYSPDKRAFAHLKLMGPNSKTVEIWVREVTKGSKRE